MGPGQAPRGSRSEALRSEMESLTSCRGPPASSQARHSRMAEDTEVWKQAFQELIQEVKPWHRWTLKLDKDLQPNVLKQGWMQYQQRIFARFQCSFCSRSWASAKVQVLFHMHWSEGESRGHVKMRVFSQRCQKCSQPQFEVPEFTQENISRVLSNLVFRILKKCYREGFKSMEEIPTVKELSLEGPHDSNNCEACLQGFCAQSGLDPGQRSAVPPSLPAPSKNATGPRAAAAIIDIPCAQPPPKSDRLPGPAVYPEVSKPSEAARAPKVSSNPKPPTAPRCQTRQVSPLSSPALEIVTRMPSPPSSSTTGGAVSGQPGLTRGKASTWTTGVPTSWSPRANTSCQVERRVHIPPLSEAFFYHMSQNARCMGVRTCCSCLLFIVVVVVIIKITGISFNL